MSELKDNKGSKQVKKRAIARLKKIKNVDKDNDMRVSIVGSVVDIDDKSLFFTLDDGKDKINVLLNNESQMQGLKLSKIVRVIGIVMPYDDSFELRGEIVQDFTGLKVESYNKYLELTKA